MELSKLNISLTSEKSLKSGAVFFFTNIIALLLFGFPTSTSDVLPNLFFSSYLTIILSIIDPINYVLKKIFHQMYISRDINENYINYGLNQFNSIKIIDLISTRIYLFIGLIASILLITLRSVPGAPFRALIEPTNGCENYNCIPNELEWYIDSWSLIIFIIIAILAISIIRLLITFVLLFRDSITPLQYVIFFEQFRRHPEITINARIVQLFFENPVYTNNIYKETLNERESKVNRMKELLKENDLTSFQYYFDEYIIDDINENIEYFVQQITHKTKNSKYSFKRLSQIYEKMEQKEIKLNEEFINLIKHGVHLSSKRYNQIIVDIIKLIDLTRSCQFNLFFDFYKKLADEIKIERETNQDLKKKFQKNPITSPGFFMAEYRQEHYIRKMLTILDSARQKINITVNSSSDKLNAVSFTIIDDHQGISFKNFIKYLYNRFLNNNFFLEFDLDEANNSIYNMLDNLFADKIKNDNSKVEIEEILNQSYIKLMNPKNKSQNITYLVNKAKNAEDKFNEILVMFEKHNRDFNKFKLKISEKTDFNFKHSLKDKLNVIYILYAILIVFPTAISIFLAKFLINYISNLKFDFISPNMFFLLIFNILAFIVIYLLIAGIFIWLKKKI